MSTAPTDSAVAWHDAECGGYAEDLPIWRELADEAAGPVLDIGAGSGRVALDLARAGHEVVALDLDAELVAAVADRARRRDLDVEALVGDIRSFRIERQFALVVIPMQTIQMIGGPPGRIAALRCCREHLEPGGLAAAAILDGLPEAGSFESPDSGYVAPLPDVAERAGWTFSSLPLSAEHDDRTLHVRRLRQLVSPAGELTEELHIDALMLMRADDLDGEAKLAGLTPVARRLVPDTDDHVGSTVTIWRNG